MGVVHAMCGCCGAGIFVSARCCCARALMSSACDVVEDERPCVSSARVRAEGDVISSPSARWPVASVSSRICDAVEGERSLSSGACARAAAFERRADVRSQLALWCAVRPLPDSNVSLEEGFSGGLFLLLTNRCLSFKSHGELEQLPSPGPLCSATQIVSDF